MDAGADADAEPLPDDDECPYALWGTTAALLSDEGEDDDDPRGVDELDVVERRSAGFEEDGFASWPEASFAAAPATPDAADEVDDFGDFHAALPAAEDDERPVQPRLGEEEVALIKSTMASLTITPPPWVRKMQHVNRIQQVLGQGGAASASDTPDEGVGGALASQWATHVQQCAGPGGTLLDSATVAKASPLLAMPTTVGATNLSGVAAPKRVSARQLAAERRALRAERKAASEGPSHKPHAAGSDADDADRRAIASDTV
jgi:hypothetical protein